MLPEGQWFVYHVSSPFNYFEFSDASSAAISRITIYRIMWIHKTKWWLAIALVFPVFWVKLRLFLFPSPRNKEVRKIGNITPHILAAVFGAVIRPALTKKNPSQIPGQSVWDLGCTYGTRTGFSPSTLIFSCQYHSNHDTIIICHLPKTDALYCYHLRESL